jgi:SagB-type dehydrogenase family enzyme
MLNFAFAAYSKNSQRTEIPTLSDAGAEARSFFFAVTRHLIPVKQSGIWSCRKAALRTAPSAGALYPLELYVIVENVENIPPGLYHYDPLKHELKQIHKEEGYAGLVAEAAFGQSWVSDAPAIIVLTGIYERTAKKYGGYAERYVHIETGHAAQNVYLQAETLGLGTTIVGAFDDDKIRAILKSDEDETPLAALPVGYPAE